MFAEKLENIKNVNSQYLTKNIKLGFIIAGIITLVLVCVAKFSWFAEKSPVSLVVRNSQPAAAIFVPKSSPAMVSLLVNPDGLQKIVPKGEFSQLKNRLLAKSNIDYSSDIKPWLGNEITLATTTIDIDRDPDNGLQTGYLIALASAKPEKSREFLELLFSQRAFSGTNLGIERYKGVKFIYDNPEYSPDVNIQNPKSKIQNNLAGAVVNNFVLLANHPQVIKEAINNLQAPDLNLISSLEYQKATQQISKNAVAVTFLNLPEVGKWQGLELAESTYNSQILSFVFNSQGLLTESTFLTNSQIVPSSSPLSQPVGALQYIPESTALAIAGTNLSKLDNSNVLKLWKQVTASIYGSSEDGTARLLQPLAKIQHNWNLNFSADIFNWVTGEYALALLPTSENTTPHWLFISEKTPELTAGITHLNNIATRSGLNVSSLTLDQQKISAWTKITATTENNTSINFDTKIKGVHTTLDNYEIFSSDLKTLKTVLSHKQKSLLENPQFQNSIATIPQPNQGYIYLDWENSQNLLKHQLPLLKLAEVLGKPLFDNLKSLTVSSYSSEPGTLKGGVFLQLH
ncbi:DUF3352 domain-containing protein [Dolichospermum compactum]|uniref:DUF3352 domain-containing protein n=1 Tax=Dolichospermum compactum NIES-806 TaxID=1973481 RepID=A0A1Z4UZJ9_9CYAN|nr:DUF3352 domain-containing protein [Dolichospermum compactum]BAZ84495.1 hypothetical protein NIES806_06820 [Dolichospermum compactum NIES-806]